MIEQYKSIGEKILKKSFWLYVFTFIVAPMWYIVKILISHSVSVEELWAMYWVLSIMTMVSAYNDLWITESLNQYIPKYIVEKRFDKIKSILLYSLLVHTITWVSIAFMFYFWAEYLSLHYFKSEYTIDILKVFSLYFLWINFFQILTTFFLAIQNTFLNKLVDLFRMLTILILSIWLFVLWDWSIVNFSFAWVKNEKILYSKSLFLEVFKYWLVVFVANQSSIILGQIDMQMVSYTLWLRSAWYYTNYLSIIAIPILVLWPIMTFLLPVFSEINATKEYSKIKLIKWFLQKDFLIFTIFINIFIFVFADKIAVLLYWSEYLDSWYILRYSILFLCFNFLFQVNFAVLAWIWKVMQRLKIILVAILFNIILNIVWMKFLWAAWSSLATWIVWVLMFIASEKLIGKEFRVAFWIKKLLINIIVFWIFWLINYIFLYYFSQNLSKWSLLLELSVSFIFWIVLYIALNISDLKHNLIELKKILKK